MPRNKKERSREKDKEEGEEREREKGGEGEIRWNGIVLWGELRGRYA